MAFRLLMLAATFAVSAAPIAAQEPFALKDGDRVVFLGNGFVEQEHAYGFLETRLSRRWPRANVVFRNMGWGGDGVQGLARTSGFQQPDGMGRLLNEIRAVKPTVLVVGYGMNESFAGEKGLGGFVQDYRKLLDQLAAPNARMVLLSPTWHEDLGRPFPDPAEHNRDLERYAEAIYQIAGERKLPFVDVLHLLRNASKEKAARRLTTNGIQLNAEGYALVAAAAEKQLGFGVPEWNVELDAQGKATAKGTVVEKVQAANAGWRFAATDTVVQVPGIDVLRLRVGGLKPGEYALRIDGKEVATASADAWNRGVAIATETAMDQGRRLRAAIVLKGELFYRRWRPFNDHSRHWGFIGGDFKLYDDEIAALEKTIADLKQPRTRTFEIAAKGAER